MPPEPPHNATTLFGKVLDLLKHANRDGTDENIERYLAAVREAAATSDSFKPFAAAIAADLNAFREDPYLLKAILGVFMCGFGVAAEMMKRADYERSADIRKLVSDETSEMLKRQTAPAIQERRRKAQARMTKAKAVWHEISGQNPHMSNRGIDTATASKVNQDPRTITGYRTIGWKVQE